MSASPRRCDPDPALRQRPRRPDAGAERAGDDHGPGHVGRGRCRIVYLMLTRHERGATGEAVLADLAGREDGLVGGRRCRRPVRYHAEEGAIALVALSKRFGDALGSTPSTSRSPSASSFAARPVRLRQDDDAADDRRLRAPHLAGQSARRPRVADVPPYRRDVNTVFQSYALFPHLSVADNVAFGLRRKGVRRPSTRRVQRCARAGPARATSAGAAPPALRRPAAAGRAGPGVGSPSGGAAARRAARRAGRRGSARRCSSSSRRSSKRSGSPSSTSPTIRGGADDVGPDRGDERGDGSSRWAPRARSTRIRRPPSSPTSSG